MPIGYAGTSPRLNGGKRSVKKKTYASRRVVNCNRTVTALRKNRGARPLTSAANHPMTVHTTAAIPTTKTATATGRARIARSKTVHLRCLVRSGSETRIGSDSGWSARGASSGAGGDQEAVVSGSVTAPRPSWSRP